MEKILDLKISNNWLQYFIHWQGYDVKKRTWELITHLSNAMKKIIGDTQASPRLFLVEFVIND
jgi:hypothetical protein